MCKDFYYIFTVLVRLSSDFLEKGFMESQVVKMNNEFTYEYLKGAVDLVKDGRPIENINFYLDYDLQRIIRNNNLDEFTIKELYIIKHIFLMIRESTIESIEDIICFSRSFLKDENYGRLCEVFHNIKSKHKSNIFSKNVYKGD
ncbi:hypothetical protein [Clostridium cylindrosporum]|uniref:Uncharacterized protein n=1 Tax=Clostridium cylindrosporum DSM 605 TaxID=1121307 RepID=A0A0J8DDH1_CLOCY|nr:hypothetical protein [Clostridium cylindrosporum]KMT22278.1 hypothetical protein CLCY_4c02510 [Clostridium cylindrosporum DSM 605]